MAFLIIGETEQAEIAKLIADAKAHILPFDMVRQGAIDHTDVLTLDQRRRMLPDFVRPRSAHMVFPGGYRAAFSFEQQPPGLCSHLSISVEGRPKKGSMPSPPAVQMIAEAFGVPFPGDKAWMEEYEPGEYAINMVSLVDKA